VLSARDGSRRYVVRVKPPGALLAGDLVTEYRTYEALQRLPVQTPRVYGVEPSEDNPFGGPFFVMEWRPGSGPNVWRARERAALEDNWQGDRSLALDFVESLVAIHGADAGAFAFLGPPQDFAEVVERWRAVYDDTQLVRDPIVEEAFAWVESRPPPDDRPGLVHGDYRIGNMLVDGGRVTGVIDWELAYRGDTRFDLGYSSLDYLAGKFVLPGSSLACAVIDRPWFYAEYERLSGRSVDSEVVRTYSALGALMLIAILATGVRLYVDGKTTDVRQAWNRFAIPGLRQDLTRLMGW
jgi:aminoglycoside phosphotransferase (APT) family kinase protein